MTQDMNMERLISELFSEDEGAVREFAEEYVRGLFPEEVAGAAFIEEVSEIMRPSIPVLRMIIGSAGYWGREIAARDILVKGKTEVREIGEYTREVALGRLGSNAKTIAGYCEKKGDAWTVGDPLTATGHVFLQNEFIAAFGDRPYRAEYALAGEPIGETSIEHGFLERRRSTKADGEEGYPTPFDVYRSWLHLVRRRHDRVGKAIEAVWIAMSGQKDASALDDVEFPDDPDAQWFGYSLVRDFKYMHKKEYIEVVELGLHFHPDHRVWGDYSLWSVLVREDGSKGTRSNLSKLLRDIYDFEINKLSWDQNVALAKTIADSGNDDLKEAIEKFMAWSRSEPDDSRGRQ